MAPIDANTVLFARLSVNSRFMKAYHALPKEARRAAIKALSEFTRSTPRQSWDEFMAGVESLC